jgi:hypothetical protein
MSPPVGDPEDQSLDETSRPGNRSSPLGDLSVDRIRSLSARPAREVILAVLLAVLLAVGVALVQIVGLYVLLLFRWAVGAGDAPGMGGWSLSSRPTEGRCSRTFPPCPRCSV